MHVGRLMTILSVKHWEVPELRRLKARIIFRGDDIRDQDNNLAVLQEAKVNPSGLAGINANLAYGSLKGHTSSQSDVCSCLYSKFSKYQGTHMGGIANRNLFQKSIVESKDHASDCGKAFTAIQKLDTIGTKGSKK